MISEGKLKENLREMIISPPTGLTSDELLWWMNGCIYARDRFLMVIEELSERTNKLDQRDI